MPRRTRVAVALGAVALAAAGLGGAVAARNFTVLALDGPDRRATLVVRRQPGLGMRWLESDRSLCRRQAPGSPLHSTTLPPELCARALAVGPATAPARTVATLPGSERLHAFASGR